MFDLRVEINEWHFKHFEKCISSSFYSERKNKLKKIPWFDLTFINTFFIFNAVLSVKSIYKENVQNGWDQNNVKKDLLLRCLFTKKRSIERFSKKNVSPATPLRHSH